RRAGATCGGPGRAELAPKPRAGDRAADRAASAGAPRRAQPGADEADRGLPPAPAGGQAAAFPDEAAAARAGGLRATPYPPGSLPRLRVENNGADLRHPS